MKKDVRKSEDERIKGMIDKDLKKITQDAVALLMMVDTISHTLECTYGDLDQSQEWTKILCNIRAFLTHGKMQMDTVQMIVEIAGRRRQQDMEKYESNQEEE